MTQPSVILEPSIVVPASVAAEIGPLLAVLLEAARRDRREVSPDVVATCEKLDLLGQGWRNRVANVAAGVAFLDHRSCTDVEWISMHDATEITGRSRQALTGLIQRGRLHGEKTGGRWRVCAVSARARKAGATCQH